MKPSKQDMQVIKEYVKTTTVLSKKDQNEFRIEAQEFDKIMDLYIK